MTVLPIAQRELRVAAHKRSTFWTRLLAAGLTLAIASLLLLIFTNSAGFVPNPGKMLFLVLSWTAFIYAIAAGVFLTSDCLSEEKREGTLGLLFLTDLRGYDVVLGKLAASSLHAAYGLVAAFPILAVCLLLGGLLAEEFWKGILAIANMLFFSLALGMLVSCFSREPVRAMNATTLFLSFLIGTPYLIDLGLADWRSVPSVILARIVTPLHPFISIQSGARAGYWSSMILSHLIGWLLLALAAWRAPYCWQETRLQQTRSAARLRKGRHRHTGQRGSNPLLWLASRGRSFRLWILAALLIVVGTAGFSAYSWRIAQDLSRIVLTVTGLLLYLWMTAHATRFFFEGMRSGALELILCSPVTPFEIVRAQWRSFISSFTLPLLFIVTTEQLVAFTQLLNQGAGTPIGSYMIANQIHSGIISITTAIAIGWFGMWMGLRSRKAHVAIIRTLVFVFVLPYIGLGLLQLTLIFVAFSGSTPDWLAPIVSCVLWVAKDMIFVWWSRRQLYTRFRETVAGIETRRVPAADLAPAFGSTSLNLR